MTANGARSATCEATECDRGVHARSLCAYHYNQTLAGTPCSFPDCGRRATSRGLCASHAWQRNHGKQLAPIANVTAADCSQDQCDRRPQTRGQWAGLCDRHARQMRDWGSAKPIRDPRPLREPERFWEHVNKLPDGCWEWQANVSAAGYGTLALGGGKYAYAHRYAWEMERSEIPEGLTIDHLCRNRKCVNPDHLEPVTQAENTRRAWAHRRSEHRDSL